MSSIRCFFNGFYVPISLSYKETECLTLGEVLTPLGMSAVRAVPSGVPVQWRGVRWLLGDGLASMLWMPSCCHSSSRVPAYFLGSPITASLPLLAARDTRSCAEVWE